MKIIQLLSLPAAIIGLAFAVVFDEDPDGERKMRRVFLYLYGLIAFVPLSLIAYHHLKPFEPVSVWTFLLFLIFTLGLGIMEEARDMLGITFLTKRKLKKS